MAPSLLKYIENFSLDVPLPQAAHEKLKRLQRDYVLIGGMPEAVQAWYDSRSAVYVADAMSANGRWIFLTD